VMASSAVRSSPAAGLRAEVDIRRDCRPGAPTH
jgi:hypothetical protein